MKLASAIFTSILGVSHAVLAAPLTTDPAAKAQAAKEIQAAGVRLPVNWTNLNFEGYKALYRDKDVKKALQFFRWNLALYGDGKARPDLLDSLAEAYVQANDRERAIAALEEALKITPDIQSDPDAASKLQRLKADPKNVAIQQKELRSAAEAFFASQAVNK